MSYSNQKNRIVLYVLIILFLLFINGCSLSLERKSNQEINKKTQINIHFFPEGANILLDGEVIGQTPLSTSLEIEAPQKFHTLEIQKENYISYIQQFSIPPINEFSLSGTLTRMASSEKIEEIGSYPGWSGDHFCYYSSEDGRIFCQENDSYKTIHSFTLPPEWIIYTEEGIYWQEKNGTALSVIYYDNEDKEDTEIACGWFAADWNMQDQTLYLFGYTQNDDQSLSDSMLILGINRNGDVKTFTLSQTAQGRLPENCSISFDGQWLLTNSSGLFELWKKDNSAFIWDRSVEDWQQANFAPQNNLTIAFTDLDGNLNTLNITENQILSVDQNAFSFAWSSEGKNIIYAKETLEGSNSLWEYDLTSRQKRILADPAVMNGSVFDLAVSSQNTMLAYANRYQRIFKLILSE